MSVNAKAVGRIRARLEAQRSRRPESWKGPYPGCEKDCARVADCEHACAGFQARRPVNPEPVAVKVGETVTRGHNVRETADRALGEV